MRRRHGNILDLSRLAEVASIEAQQKSDLVSKLDKEVAEPLATVELGLWLGVLSNDLELSDFGVALRWLHALGAETTEADGRGSRDLLLWLLIRADALVPALILSSRKSHQQTSRGYLRAALARLIDDLRAAAAADELVPAIEITEYLERVVSDPELESELLGARLEMLAQLRIIEPLGAATETSLWGADHRLESLRARFENQNLTHDGIRSFLDRRYFSAITSGGSDPDINPPSSEQILYWMAEAYEAVQRPLGFTPGRPLALCAGILAARQSVTLEIEHAYSTIYAAADSEWSQYLHFSGGSRFDREFLIRIEPELSSKLEDRLHSESMAEN